MKPIIDFSECLKDSPKFRNTLEDAEDDIEQLEMKLEKLVKLCSATVESGKVYINSKAQFINGIKELVFYFKDDTFNVNALNKLIQALQEMDKYQSILIDQAKRTVCKNLGDFIHSDVRKVKETKRCFEKYSDEYDQALIRSSQAPRTKQHECEEANNAAKAARSGFQHTSLDYICQISMLQSKKRYEILDTLLSYLHAQSTFFHQGSDLCQDVDPFMKQLASNLTRVRGEAGQLERSMDDRHALANEKEASNQQSNNGVRLEGYLFKRTSNAFKSWKRRWFVIKNQQLVYCKRAKDMSVTVMEEDLRLCTVKPVVEVDRRFCFEVLSPSKGYPETETYSRKSLIPSQQSSRKRRLPHVRLSLTKLSLRSHVLQADTEEMYNMWISSLQAGIGAALHLTVHGQKEGSSKSSKEDVRTESQKENGLQNADGTSTDGSRLKSPWEEVVSIAGNDKCCDCGSAQPQWASINLGNILCIDCSGVHRSLGVHHSKVRSLRLDDWDPELIKLMKGLGNSFINSVYEGAVDESVAVRPTAESPSAVREAWIKAKYVKKAFVAKPPANRAKIHLLRTPNIRQPRRPSLQPKIADTKSPEATGNVEICADSQSDMVVRERKHSVVPANELHSKRAAVIFEGTASAGGNRQTIVHETQSNNVDDSSHSVLRNASSESVPSTAIGDSRVDNAVIATDDSDEYSDDEDEDDFDPNLQLYRASGAADLQEMCKALALCANVSWVNVDDDQRCPIHEAIASGSVVACEYLFLNGAKIDAKDNRGKTPLHFASDLGFTGHVCLLLKRGADQKAKDTFEKDALSYAVDNANADIVTLLRLAKLNEEMKETEFGNSDETFNEVVRDFSQRASSAPEFRKRPSLGSSGSN